MSDFSIAEAVHNAFQNHAIVDIHTHLYPPPWANSTWPDPTNY